MKNLGRSKTLNLVMVLLILVAQFSFAGTAVAVAPMFAFTDEDADKVYFNGDQIGFDLPDAGLLEGTALRIALGVDNGGGSLDYSKAVLQGMTDGGSYHFVEATANAGGGFSVVGTVNNPGNNTLPTGVLAVTVYTEMGPGNWVEVVSDLPVVDAGAVQALVGVAVPDGSVTVTPALSEIDNLYATEQALTFTASGGGYTGSITFPAGLNLIGSVSELVNLQEGITLLGAINVMTNEITYFAGINTAAISFLEDKGATISIQGFPTDLALNDFTIANDGDGTSSNPSFTGGTLTFDVNHFSTYTITAPAQAGPSEVALDAGSDGSPDSTFATIQEAVYAASPGDTIIVPDGTYREDVVVDTANLIIKSAGGAVNTTVYSDTPDRFPFKITASGVTIDGFNIKTGGNESGGARAGVYLCFTGDNSTDATIKNNTFSAATGYLGSYGIVANLLANGRLSVSNNTIEGLGGSAITVMGAVADSVVTISNNTVSGGEGGIAFAREITNSTVDITNNTISTPDGNGIDIDHMNQDNTVNITGNTITGSTGNGIYVGEIGPEEVGVGNYHNELTVSGNTVQEIKDYGIYVSQVDFDADVLIENNKILDGESHGLVLEYLGQKGADWIGEIVAGTVYFNNPAYPDFCSPVVNVKGNTITGNAEAGIYQYDSWMYGTKVTFADNTVAKNGSGFYCDGDYRTLYSTEVTFTDNTITDNDSTGIELFEVDNSCRYLIGQGNDISNNGGYGINLQENVDGVEVSGNIIRDNGTGVYIGGTGNSIVGNYVYGNRELRSGIHVAATSSDTAIRFNDLVGNEGDGIYAEDGITTYVYGALNYWGDASGPGQGEGDTVSAKVYTSPWITGAALNTSAVSLQPGGSSQLFLTAATKSDMDATGSEKVPDKTVRYSSSNTQVATVDGAGKIMAVANGTAIITAHLANNPTVTVTVTSPGNGGGSGDSGSTSSATAPAPGPQPVASELDTGSSVTVTTSRQNGQTVATVTIDNNKMAALLDGNKEAETIVIPVSQTSDVVRAELPNNILSRFVQENRKNIAVETNFGSYVLPVTEIKIEQLAGELGVLAKDVKLNIVIARPTAEQLSAIQNQVAASGLTEVAAPVEFKIEVTAGEKQKEISSFGSYVTRTVKLNKTIDANHAVGVMVNPDGTLSPVPTRFITVNGEMAAELMRRGNSTYTVVQTGKSFSDITSHWAKADVNLLASKLIINGTSADTFTPEGKVTRAQLAAMLVRALGLTPLSAKANFSDVKSSDWFAGAVGAAVDAGIIKGYSDGSFRPNANVTREEAAVMMVNALKTAGIDAAISDGDTNAYLGKFGDGVKIGSWARQAVAAAVKYGIITGNSRSEFKPAENSTRAESAVMIKKMMEKAKFI